MSDFFKRAASHIQHVLNIDGVTEVHAKRIQDVFMPEWKDTVGTFFKEDKPVKGEGRHYMDYAARIPCVLCQDTNIRSFNPVELHHEPPKRMGGGNSSDFDVVPLCKTHHDLMHGKLSLKRSYDLGILDVRFSNMEKLLEHYRPKLERWKTKILINYIRAREKE